MKITEQANGRVQVRTFQALNVSVAYGKGAYLSADGALLRQLDSVERAAEEYDECVAAAKGDKTRSAEDVRATTKLQRSRFADTVAMLRANAEEARRRSKSM